MSGFLSQRGAWPLVVISASLAAPAWAAESPEELVAALRTERDDTKRNELVVKLRKLGDKAIPALLKSWEGAREENAVALLYLLGDRRGAEVEADLLKAARKASPILRAAAATCLSPFTSKAVRERLLELANDREEPVGIASLESLALQADPQTFDELLRSLSKFVAENPNAARVVKAQKALGAILSKSKSGATLSELCRASSEFDPALQNVILKALDFAEGKIVAAFLNAALAEYLDPQGVDTRELERAVGERSAADSIRPISPALAATAAEVLGRQKEKKVAPLLLKALEDKQPDVRFSALQVLHLVLPRGPSSPGDYAPSDFPALRRDAYLAVMTRLSDRNTRIRDRAHAWLKRETKQDLARSYPEWRAWFDKYFEGYEAPQ